MIQFKNTDKCEWRIRSLTAVPYIICIYIGSYLILIVSDRNINCVESNKSTRSCTMKRKSQMNLIIIFVMLAKTFLIE